MASWSADELRGIGRGEGRGPESGRATLVTDEEDNGR
jgi:hypothetical protein